MAVMAHIRFGQSSQWLSCGLAVVLLTIHAQLCCDGEARSELINLCLTGALEQQQSDEHLHDQANTSSKGQANIATPDYS